MVGKRVYNVYITLSTVVDGSKSNSDYRVYRFRFRFISWKIRQKSRTTGIRTAKIRSSVDDVVEISIPV